MPDHIVVKTEGVVRIVGAGHRAAAVISVHIVVEIGASALVAEAARIVEGVVHRVMAVRMVEVAGAADLAHTVVVGVHADLDSCVLPSIIFLVDV